MEFTLFDFAWFRLLNFTTITTLLVCMCGAVSTVALMKSQTNSYNQILPAIVTISDRHSQSRGLSSNLIRHSSIYQRYMKYEGHLEDTCTAGYDLCFDANTDEYTCITAGSNCCGNGNSCPSGYVCSSSSCESEADAEAKCNPSPVPSSDYLFEECYVYTSSSPLISSDTSTCMPIGFVCCGNGYICPQNTTCGGEYYCLDSGNMYCPDLASGGSAGVMPTGSTCCFDGFYCPAGYVCESDGTCCPVDESGMCVPQPLTATIAPASGATLSEFTLAPLPDFSLAPHMELTVPPAPDVTQPPLPSEITASPALGVTHPPQPSESTAPPLPDVTEPPLPSEITAPPAAYLTHFPNAEFTLAPETYVPSFVGTLKPVSEANSLVPLTQSPIVIATRPPLSLAPFSPVSPISISPTSISSRITIAPSISLKPTPTTSFPPRLAIASNKPSKSPTISPVIVAASVVPTPLPTDAVVSSGSGSTYLGLSNVSFFSIIGSIAIITCGCICLLLYYYSGNNSSNNLAKWIETAGPSGDLKILKNTITPVNRPESGHVRDSFSNVYSEYEPPVHNPLSRPGAGITEPKEEL